jgi:hypothetical protein
MPYGKNAGLFVNVKRSGVCSDHICKGLSDHFSFCLAETKIIVSLVFHFGTLQYYRTSAL